MVGSCSLRVARTYLLLSAGVLKRESAITNRQTGRQTSRHPYAVCQLEQHVASWHGEEAQNVLNSQLVPIKPNSGSSACNEFLI